VSPANNAHQSPTICRSFAVKTASLRRLLVMNWRGFFALLHKEIVLEWRRRYALSGIVLYVVSMVFVVYVASSRPTPPVWNTLFWLIALFASINALVKSFVRESSDRQLYYYQLTDPVVLVLAKIGYNTLLLMVLSGLASVAFILVTDSPVQRWLLFTGILALGSLSFSIAFTFISSIAAKADQSATLVAILSFPVVLPILLTLLRLTAATFTPADLPLSIWPEVRNLLAIDAILIALAVVLFPYIWRD
jgi:heme exporter protein B